MTCTITKLLLFFSRASRVAQHETLCDKGEVTYVTPQGECSPCDRACWAQADLSPALDVLPLTLL